METLIYLLIIFFSVAQSAAVKAFNRHTNDPALFNVLKASVSFLMFLIMAANGFTLHLHTLFFGSFYGLFLCISMYTGYRALCLGPLALTSMFVSFSVLIPLIWGFAVRKESLNCAQITAIILLIFILVCLVVCFISCYTGDEPRNVGIVRAGVELLGADSVHRQSDRRAAVRAM